MCWNKAAVMWNVMILWRIKERRMSAVWSYPMRADRLLVPELSLCLMWYAGKKTQFVWFQVVHTHTHTLLFHLKIDTWPPCRHLKVPFGCCFGRAVHFFFPICFVICCVSLCWTPVGCSSELSDLAGAAVVFGKESNVWNMPIEPSSKPLARPQSRLKISWDHIYVFDSSVGMPKKPTSAWKHDTGVREAVLESSVSPWI